MKKSVVLTIISGVAIGLVLSAVTITAKLPLGIVLEPKIQEDYPTDVACMAVIRTEFSNQGLPFVTVRDNECPERESFHPLGAVANIIFGIGVSAGIMKLYRKRRRK